MYITRKYNILNYVAGALQVCTGESDAHIRCHRDAIIVMESAEYGRKEIGRCITEANDFMGCTNDVLPLIDRWCSGHRECSLVLVDELNRELTELNENCLKVLIKYLQVEYVCMTGRITLRYMILHQVMSLIANRMLVMIRPPPPHI